MHKEKNSAVFICELPPPYGGVTVKNKLLYELISESGNINVIDLMECKRTFWKTPYILFKCIKEWIYAENIIYGIGTSERLKYLLKIQKNIRKSFSRTSVIAMGGIFDKRVLQDKFLNLECKKLKGIWVETDGMKNNLDLNKFDNVYIFPNPKTGKGCCSPKKVQENNKLKVLYFSQISKEKGVTDIFNTIVLLEESYGRKQDFTFDFYGHIVENFKDEFSNFIEKRDCVKYHGVFDSTKNSLYKKLNEYDVLLFPTHWDTEGVPGILVESKMSGLAIIASQKSYNKEIVREDCNEGIIIKDNYSVEMAQALVKMKDNPEWLMMLKENSYNSRVRFELEKYQNISIELLSNSHY